MSAPDDREWTSEYCVNGRYVVQSTREGLGPAMKDWRIWDTSDQVVIRTSRSLHALLESAHYLNRRHDQKSA